jgi:RNA polymerase-binding transcription factor DksA
MTRMRLRSFAVMLQAQLQRAEMCLEQVGLLRAALARIAAGTYGQCVRCDGEIGMVRLTALPHAVFCIPCQEYSFQHPNTGNLPSRRIPDEGGHSV